MSYKTKYASIRHLCNPHVSAKLHIKAATTLESEFVKLAKKYPVLEDKERQKFDPICKIFSKHYNVNVHVHSGTQDKLIYMWPLKFDESKPTIHVHRKVFYDQNVAHFAAIRTLKSYQAIYGLECPYNCKKVDANHSGEYALHNGLNQ